MKNRQDISLAIKKKQNYNGDDKKTKREREVAIVNDS
jgi:hypothetical protein